jgi:hypothetical protein
VGVRWDGWSGGIRAKFRGKVFKTTAVRDEVANVLHSMDMEATTKGCERGGEDANLALPRCKRTSGVELNMEPEDPMMII